MHRISQRERERGQEPKDSTFLLTARDKGIVLPAGDESVKHLAKMGAALEREAGHLEGGVRVFDRGPADILKVAEEEGTDVHVDAAILVDAVLTLSRLFPSTTSPYLYFA